MSAAAEVYQTYGVPVYLLHRTHRPVVAAGRSSSLAWEFTDAFYAELANANYQNQYTVLVQSPARPSPIACNLALIKRTTSYAALR